MIYDAGNEKHPGTAYTVITHTHTHTHMLTHTHTCSHTHSTLASHAGGPLVTERQLGKRYASVSRMLRGERDRARKTERELLLTKPL